MDGVPVVPLARRYPSCSNTVRRNCSTRPPIAAHRWRGCQQRRFIEDRDTFEPPLEPGSAVKVSLTREGPPVAIKICGNDAAASLDAGDDQGRRAKAGGEPAGARLHERGPQPRK